MTEKAETERGWKPMLLRLSPEDHALVMQAAAFAGDKPQPGSIWARAVVVEAAKKILKKIRNSP